MGFRVRKRINLGGGTRINLSKSGVGFSVGTKGARYTKKAGGGTRTTFSAPGTGISYVKETGGRSRSKSTSGSTGNRGTGGPGKRRTWLWILGWLFIFPLPLTMLLLRKKNLHPAIKFPIIAIAWLFYLFFCWAVSSTDNAETETKTTEVTQTTEAVPETTEAVVQAESITVDGLKTEMVLGEKAEVTATVMPEEAEDKDITWTVSDESILTIDEEGIVRAVGAGTATVIASTANGVSSETEVTVDGSKRVMYVRYDRDRDDDVNIGDEWSFTSEINGERSTREYILSVGDELDFYERYTEDDSDPDIGEASASHTVTEEDLEKGFQINMDMKVTENGGRNSGESAHFRITYEFLTE